jgi:hypothetical protein
LLLLCSVVGCRTLLAPVGTGWIMHRPVVLLSPACASSARGGCFVGASAASVSSPVLSRSNRASCDRSRAAYSRINMYRMI